MTREERNAKARKYYWEHREALLEYGKKWRAERSEVFSEQQRFRYQINQQLYGEEQSWIAEARMKKGWSQEAVAKMVGVTQGTITRLETGAMPFRTFSRREELCRVLEVDR